MINLNLFLWTVVFLLVFYQAKRIKKYKNLNESEKSLIASITHDLKTPANAQINMLNLLLKGQFGELNPNQYEMIKLTCNSSKYMSNLVGTITNSYKYDSGKIRPSKEYFDLNSVIHNVCIENKFLAKEKNLAVILNYNEDNCIIYADKIQIERVVSNLLSNALTYSFENSFIIIDLITDKNFIDFSINNKSNPISVKELKNIFKKFAKSKNSKFNKSSTGLGLYTAKRIIESHKGKMYAQCTHDGIYTFGFRLLQKRVNQIQQEKV